MRDRVFYSVEQFAEKVGVCYRTVYNGIKKGHIDAFRVGRGKGASYRIAHTEIQRLGFFNLEVVINALIDAKLKERDEREDE